LFKGGNSIPCLAIPLGSSLDGKTPDTSERKTEDEKKIGVGFG